MSKTKVGTKICTLDDLCFPVELHDNPRQTNQEYSKVVTGIIDDKEVDLNYCSPVYQLVPNQDIFPKIEEILNSKGIEFTAKYTNTQNARFYGNYIIEDSRFAYKMNNTNDVIKFIWNFQHSYNGLTKYRGIAGFYRMICENGLVIPVKEMNEYNLFVQGKHTPAILHSFEEFSRIIENVIQNLGNVKTSIVKKYELLGGHVVTKPEDRILEVLKANKIIVIERPNFNTVENIMSKINTESNDDRWGYNGKINDWLVYNGINQYVNDNSRTISSPEKRKEIDSKVLEYMLEYVSY